MSATYSGDPTASALDEVRFLIGDTDMSNPLLSDHEIGYLTTNYADDNILAAAYAAEAIASTFGRKSDMSIGKLKVSAGTQRESYDALAKSLFDRARATISLGGLTISGKDALYEDDDAVQPSFRRGIHDNPSAGGRDGDPRTYDPDA